MGKNKNEIKYNERDIAIRDALGANPNGLTLAQLSEVTGDSLKAGHIVHAINAGLVEVYGEEQIERPSKRKVCAYRFVTGEMITATPDGKKVNYTDSEKQILEVAERVYGDGTPFSLAQLSEQVGRKLSSGSISALVKTKGNLEKAEETVEQECTVKSAVQVYGLTEKGQAMYDNRDAEQAAE